MKEKGDYRRELISCDTTQMVTKHKDPKTIQRYDHARENLDNSPVNTLNWDTD